MTYIYHYFSVAAWVFLFIPQVLFAQTYFGEVDTFFNRAVGFIDKVLVPLIFVFVFLVFLYGMFKYFIAEGANDASRETGKKLVLWSIMGFVLMVSIWGIVNIVAEGLFGTTSAPTLPGTPTIEQGGAGGRSTAPYYNFDRSGPQ